MYIILKLKRKERPFIEQVFFDFKNIWSIYTQIVKNDAFNQLNTNEWLNFVENLSAKHNFQGAEQVFEQADQSMYVN